MRCLTIKMSLRRRQKLATKDKIIKVVIDYIKQDKDVNQIPLSEIAKKANIGKSTVYEYFENKEALIQDTYMYLLNYYEQQILKPLKEKTFKKAFIEQISKILGAMKDAKRLVETMLNNHNQINFLNNQVVEEKMNEISNHMEKRFLEIFKIGVLEKYIPDDIKESPTRGYVIQALITGLLFQFINKQTDLTEEALLDLIYVEVYKALKN